MIDVVTADIGTFFQVEWNGLSTERNYTWNPIIYMYTDVLDLIIVFSSHKKKKTLISAAKRHLGIDV